MDINRNTKSNEKEDLVLYGGTYLNKGGAAIAYGTFKALKEVGVVYNHIVDPEPFFPFDSLGLTPIYRFSDILATKPLSTVSPLYTYKPFFKCLIESRKQEIKKLSGIPIWHIGDSPFSDARSALSLIGQVIALETLRRNMSSTTIIGGVSISHPKTSIGRYITQKYFKNYYWFVRGTRTFNILTKLGVPEENISVISDFAFQLDKIKTKTSRNISKKIGGSEKPVVALCIREYGASKLREKYLEGIIKLVPELKKEYEIFFVPTSYSYLIPENDYIFIKKTLKITDNEIINICNLTPGEIIDVFSNFDAVISARLHGAIYGILANVPTIHLYEESKSLEVITEKFGENIPLIKIEKLTDSFGIKMIKNTINSILTHKDEIKNELYLGKKEARTMTIKVLKETLPDIMGGIK